METPRRDAAVRCGSSTAGSISPTNPPHEPPGPEREVRAYRASLTFVGVRGLRGSVPSSRCRHSTHLNLGRPGWSSQPSRWRSSRRDGVKVSGITRSAPQRPHRINADGFFHVSLLPYVRQRTKLDACTRRCQTGWNEGLVGTGRVRPIGGFSESQVRYAHAEDLRQPAAVEEAWHRVAGFPRLH